MAQRLKMENAPGRWLLGARGQYVFTAAAAIAMLCYFTYYWQRASWKLPPDTLHHQRLAGLIDSTQPLSFETVRKAAAVLDPELMSRVPKKFCPEYKSPCWTAEGKGEIHSLQCLPEVFVMGGFHTGSTTLQQKLAMHPHIAAGQLANTHFWSEDRVRVGEYLKLTEELQPRITENPDKTVVMDGSQSYLTFYWAEDERVHREYRRVMVPCWQNCSRFFSKKADQWGCLESSCYPMARFADKFAAKDLGVPYLLLHFPLLIRGAYGLRSPRFVVMLRDPVERLQTAYQQYEHYKARYGRTPHALRRYVLEQLLAFRKCSDQHGDINCILYFETFGLEQEGTFFHADQLLRGVYSVFVELWLQYFPRQNFLFIRSEDFFTDPNTTMQAVLDHVGLEKPSEEIWSSMVRAYVPPSNRPGSLLTPDTVKMLRDFYEPYNRRLSELLGPNFYWP